MATDLALLGWAAAGPSRLVYRTYEWARPTLSLGRAEPFPEGWDLESIAKSDLDVVRRPTGGDAVLHDGELTFAVAASLPGAWGLRPRAFAERVADAVAEALRSLDLRAERAGAASAPPPARPGDHPCFARTAPGEVRVGEFKVAGIASRFTRGGALSHASVPLTARHRDVATYRSGGVRDRAALERHARSAAELLGREVGAARLGDRIAVCLEGGLGVELREADFEDLGIQAP